MRGGSYGMALLAAYRLHRADGEALAAYLNRCVFADAQSTTLSPDPAEQSGFAAFLTQYQTALKAERAVVKIRAIPHNSKCRYGERGAAAAGAVLKP